MSKAKQGDLVYILDRDDILTNWLHNMCLSMSDELFFEYKYTNEKVSVVAGIDYYSKDDILSGITVKRHRNICDRLDIPYFVTEIIGTQNGYMKRVDGYRFKRNECNQLAKRFIDTYHLDSTVSEQTYSNILHVLRGRKSLYNIMQEEDYSEVYHQMIPFKKAFRERHALYGKDIYQTDVDLILYSSMNPLRPILIIEFKSHVYESERYNSSPGQADCLQCIGRRLGIPVFRVWHPANNLSEFYFLRELTGCGVWQNYFTNFKVSGAQFAGDLHRISATM